MNKNILVVGATKDSSDSFDTFDISSTSTFPIQSLHKVWGDVAGKYNKGVNSRNVYIGENAENVSYIHNGTLKSMSQKVLYMEAHGDLYNGSIPGLMKNPSKPKKDPNCYDPSTRKISRSDEGVCKQDIVTLPSCPNWVEIPVGDNYNKRVGGCGCTRDNFGPGVYNVLCYVPKTTDLATDGRGYVFAVWPFNYTEVYGKDKDQTPPVATETSQYRNNSDFPCYNECENENNVGPNAAINPKCPGGVDGKGCKGDGDLFSVINHELDIEIPANSPQWADDWKTKMTWSTMNCNTWLNDISDYSTDTGAFYPCLR